ncbi:MFS transporter [Dermatophilus congolensis]|uniref:MFS transporter n=8 Tax=Dermatophilus congolensis TaxID=1863 RepID=UPI001AAE5D8F|nr:MFS transporter [Dermatophilus congolensis]MBO3129792.1 MFS transporter [Dermatophilus congolensis]MBO3131579.1 MFS transporter [Dermatophilus congolensis]MBO3134268.1 MFS transporter [Dermatophilus congolensis]MBO3138746.1 MFS transporter [Dermatophilus congolensis]MBO3140982.1 MFS transporter [Dermatophilus congolensis]
MSAGVVNEGVGRTRAERLDVLPFTWMHGRLLVGSGVGWALDAMDVGLISFVMAALGKQWHLSDGALSLIGSIGFVGMAVGATLGGLLADRFGRRQVFAGTLLVYGVATGASALATGVGLLMALRFLVGLGLGAELPVASTLVSEYSPRHIRGRMVVALESFWAVGWIFAALIAYFVIPSSPDGWRWALGIGVVPTVYAVGVRFGLPESVRFLERAGRVDEAEAAVRRFEKAAGVSGVGGGSVGGVEVVVGEVAGGIWSSMLRWRTVSLWVVWFMVNFSYYGAFIWLPSLLAKQGFDLVKSFEYTLVITLAQLPGYAVSAWLIERWGRRATLVVFLVGSACAAGVFGFASSPLLIVVFGMVLSFFNLGAWGALYAVSPEVYPTAVRGVGVGAAAGCGRIASVVAPLSVPFLLGVGGNVLVFVVFGVAFGVAAVAALGLPEMRSQALG